MNNPANIKHIKRKQFSTMQHKLECKHKVNEPQPIILQVNRVLYRKRVKLTASKQWKSKKCRDWQKISFLKKDATWNGNLKNRIEHTRKKLSKLKVKDGLTAYWLIHQKETCFRDSLQTISVKVVFISICTSLILR